MLYIARGALSKLSADNSVKYTDILIRILGKIDGTMCIPPEHFRFSRNFDIGTVTTIRIQTEHCLTEIPFYLLRRHVDNSVIIPAHIIDELKKSRNNVTSQNRFVRCIRNALFDKCFNRF